MSLSIRVAKGRYQGDPGFLGDFGKFLGGAVKTVASAGIGFLAGGPVGAITGGLGALGILKGSTPATTAGMNIPSVNVRGIVEGDQTLPGIGPSSCAGFMIGGKCIGGSWGQGSAQIGVTPMGPIGVGGGGAPVVMQNGQLCALKGTHLNRTAYATRSGWVPAGTKCVKNRRMNPLNPSALSRSMRRVASFSRATRSIERELGKLGRAHGPKRAPAGRRGKCGCK